ncbi:MAG: DEAD/DEAH box helicase [Actinomycetota bacterium]
MNVFELRKRLINDYSSYVRSFINIRDERIRQTVDRDLDAGLLWPEPRIGLNPSFETGGWIDELVDSGLLLEECRRIFRIRKTAEGAEGEPMRLHRHQVDAINAAKTGKNYVLTTGTGSGKSLAYIVPIVDHVLRAGSGRGIKAIVVYPMNALANSQAGELTKFLSFGYPDGRGPVTFRKYTGQESDEERNEIIASPPDILLTNYVMLELILTRVKEKGLILAARGLRFLVLDELHTYRGRQGADVALLVRRTREACEARELQCVGTSATLATQGSFPEQREEIARVASLLFGSVVPDENVIGETLRRETGGIPNAEQLTTRLGSQADPPADYDGFVADPLSSWIETTFGIEEREGRLVRTPPRAVGGPGGAAEQLSTLTEVGAETCQTAIERQLLAGYGAENPDTRFPVFAFRLHQFISRGDTAYATIEPEDERYITTQPQQFVPGDRSKRLFPLVFCRECGQEYYSGQLAQREGAPVLEQRDPEERIATEEEVPGYLYFNTASPWSETDESRVPEDWIEERPDGKRIRLDRRKWLPKPLEVDPLGHIDRGGLQGHFIEAPFRFCLTCGVTYGGRLRQDFTKVGMLGSEGRSTATTILSQSVVRTLREMVEGAPENEIQNVTPKLLSFTDNRQDAALQAGHFNDFVDVGLLRSALYRAVLAAGTPGLTHDVLTQRVFDELALPFENYAANPAAEFKARTDTERALRDVLGYRLYLDLRRGWRISSPNLEQCGLLEVAYESLDEVCEAERVWNDCHDALVGATAERRKQVSRTLLDHMRRELAIKVDYLGADFQERLRQTSSQRLISPWALDDQEEPEHAAVMLPRARRPDDYRGWSYLSPRSGFGIYLRRELGFKGLADTEVVTKQLLAALERGGLVEKVLETKDDGPDGYQIPASAFVWTAGDGTRAFHDPIRVPHPSKEGVRPNPFFVAFYKTIAAQGRGLRAGEHTAAVPYDKRIEREEAFRQARLPVLFCSPTMELGVDIADLNIVNMRNVPPTPANYAQRSGRAGRSGQPALVFTYCSAGSPHDQYFFRHQQEMVSGQVAPPRIDLTNEDLIRSHVHAIWLTAAGMSLGGSLKDVLELSGEPPTLRLLDYIQADLSKPEARAAGRDRSARVLADVESLLAGSDWWTPEWLDDVLNAMPQSFEAACDRWRSLYSAARNQAELQHKIIIDHSRQPADKRQAERLRREAVAQMDLLTADTGDALFQSDFYSYRYFASEGFLPGYSFPRLPLSAFVPGRRGTRGTDEFLNRPRFLAISEFGPRNIIYYEGSRFVINKVILPVGTEVEGSDQPVLTRSVKQCDSCGYLHPLEGDVGPDLCEGCGEPLNAAMDHLFRLQNVATKRRDRINSDEEERTRHGYDLRTGLRFARKDGRTLKRTASVQAGDTEIGRLEYGHTATLWRINLGWRRRANKHEHGFVLDMERGFWARRQDDPVNDDPDDPMSARTMRVIPFVEDRKNCLTLELGDRASAELLSSLQAALKNAITVTYQLEDHELAAEPLPSPQDRRRLLIYEASEGGAGVLRRLVEDPGALGVVAKRALELCHYDPETFEDRGRAPGATEACEAACYDCLMSYMNQPEHRLLDRKLVKDLLVNLAGARIMTSPVQIGRGEHLDRLKRVAASELERRWLDFIDGAGHTLPDRAGTLLEAAGTRPDFLYDSDFAAIYIDGPPHDFPDRQVRDREKHARLEDLGYTVIRFAADAQWAELIGRYPWVFGKRNG